MCCRKPLPEGLASWLQVFPSWKGQHGGGGPWVWPAPPAPRPTPGRPCPQSCRLLASGCPCGGVCAGRRYVRDVDAGKARPASQQCWSLGPRALLLAGLRRAGADAGVRGWGGKASDHTDHSPGPPRPISWSRSPGLPGGVSPKNQRQQAPPAGGANHPPGRDVWARGHHALGRPARGPASPLHGTHFLCPSARLPM